MPVGLEGVAAPGGEARARSRSRPGSGRCRPGRRSTRAGCSRPCARRRGRPPRSRAGWSASGGSAPARPGRRAARPTGARPATASLASPGRTYHRLRDRSQRGGVLDRLMGRPVLAQADRVVGPDVGDRQAGQGGQAHGAAHVVAEGQERGAVRLEAAVHRRSRWRSPPMACSRTPKRRLRPASSASRSPGRP